MPATATPLGKIWLRHARIASRLAHGRYDSIVDGGASIGEFAAHRAQPEDAVRSCSMVAARVAERPTWTVATLRLVGLAVPGRRVLVKLDLQGAEPQALEGMGELWSRCAGLLLEVSYGERGNLEPLLAAVGANGFFEAASFNKLEAGGGVVEADRLWLRRDDDAAKERG